MQKSSVVFRRVAGTVGSPGLHTAIDQCGSAANGKPGTLKAQAISSGYNCRHGTLCSIPSGGDREAFGSLQVVNNPKTIWPPCRLSAF